MHVLKSIDIHGFRGQSKPIKLKFSRNANFLIGRNGTGKTTLINIINAVLSLDQEALRFHRWTKIVVRFCSDGSREVPNLEIRRPSDRLAGLISFIFRPSASAEPVKFNFPARDRFVIRDGTRQRVTSRARIRQVQRNLRDHVDSLYNLTWLSLARADDSESIDDVWDDASSGNDVDRKLVQSFQGLMSYFSRLDGSVSDETQEFQKYWFLSFLKPAGEADTRKLKEIDLDQEEIQLRTIFEKFEVMPDEFEFQMRQHFERVRSARDRKDENVFTGIDQVGVIYDALRLHSLVERWQALQLTQKSTYRPKTDFIRLASDMLFQKTVRVNRSNAVEIIDEDGDPIEKTTLSSGEKQLLIFLSETLLQEGKPHIFLADEPELSLHVEWQEDLVPSLLKLNPQAQVFFATHSPDIVGQFQKNIIHMESLI